MVPKSGSRLPKSRFLLSDSELARLIAEALQAELGASRRATKTVMTWAEVSDHTARSWLNGKTTPSGFHLVLLAAHCPPVLSTVLRITGHGEAAISLNIEAIEAGLEEVLSLTRQLRSRSH